MRHWIEKMPFWLLVVIYLLALGVNYWIRKRHPPMTAYKLTRTQSLVFWAVMIAVGAAIWFWSAGSPSA